VKIKNMLKYLSIIAVIVCGLVFGGFKIIQIMKFDTAVSITVAKGPFKGVNFKLMNYQVSVNDLNYQQDFWDSTLGKAIFNQLSSTLQTVVKAGSAYINVEFDMNFFGIWHRHYDIHDAVHFVR
jgi:hypothetical protein